MARELLYVAHERRRSMGEGVTWNWIIAALAVVFTLAGASGVPGPARSELLLALGTAVALALSRHPGTRRS
jgi:hypothetical protein